MLRFYGRFVNSPHITQNTKTPENEQLYVSLITGVVSSPLIQNTYCRRKNYSPFIPNRDLSSFFSLSIRVQLQALESSELQVFAVAGLVVVEAEVASVVALEVFRVTVAEVDLDVFFEVADDVGFVVLCVAANDVGFVAVVPDADLEVVAAAVVEAAFDVAAVDEEVAAVWREMTSPLRSSDTAKNCDQ